MLLHSVQKVPQVRNAVCEDHTDRCWRFKNRCRKQKSDYRKRHPVSQSSFEYRSSRWHYLVPCENAVLVFLSKNQWVLHESSQLVINRGGHNESNTALSYLTLKSQQLSMLSYRNTLSGRLYIHNVHSMEIVSYCRTIFQFALPSTQVTLRSQKFIVKYRLCDNLYCKYV